MQKWTTHDTSDGSETQHATVAEAKKAANALYEREGTWFRAETPNGHTVWEKAVATDRDLLALVFLTEHRTAALDEYGIDGEQH